MRDAVRNTLEKIQLISFLDKDLKHPDSLHFVGFERTFSNDCSVVRANV